MQTRNILLFFSAFLIVISFSVWNYLHSPKIAYVNNTKLFKNFSGYREALEKYQKQHEFLQANLDSLSKEYETQVKFYQSKESSLSEEEKKQYQSQLIRQERNVIGYKKAIEQKITEEESKLQEGVYNQVNSYIKEYGTTHGYDYILGSSGDGNLLFAKDSKDITEEVLIALNQKYEGK